MNGLPNGFQGYVSACFPFVTKTVLQSAIRRGDAAVLSRNVSLDAIGLLASLSSPVTAGDLTMPDQS